MARKKKKKDINLDALNFKPLLEECVASSRLGRALASFGSTLTGREKRNANFVYLLLKAGRELPEKTPTTAKISKDEKSKTYSPTDAIKWFSNKYPKKAEPLLARLKEEYDRTETKVIYGVQSGRDLSDDYYVNVLVDILEIPRQDAAVMYHGVIKPQFERLEEEEGLVSLVMDKG